jgi:hypothetical protein
VHPHFEALGRGGWWSALGTLWGGAWPAPRPHVAWYSRLALACGREHEQHACISTMHTLTHTQQARAHTHTHTHTYTHTHTHAHTCTHMHKHAQTCTNIHTHTCTCTLLLSHRHKHAFSHMHMRARTHPYTHSHTTHTAHHPPIFIRSWTSSKTAAGCTCALRRRC